MFEVTNLTFSRSALKSLTSSAQEWLLTKSLISISFISFSLDPGSSDDLSIRSHC